MFQLQSDGYRDQNAATLESHFPGLELKQTHLTPRETKFDLTWHVIDRADELLVAVEFRTALFEESRIERMIDHFERLLGEVVRDPRQIVSAVAMLSENERSAVLRAGRGECVPPPTADFVQAFDAQAAATPHAISVRDDNGSLSYQQLEQRAETVACRLRNLVAAGNVVSVEAPRSIEQLVAVLGVMKSGNAYLPIDPDLPESRRDFMRVDAGCVAGVKSDGRHEFEFTTSASLDADSAAAAGRLRRSDARSSAYVIYTSGSTGRPKGTVVTQVGLMNYLRWCTNHYPYRDGWGAPVQSSFGFDATITSMLAPLLVGKTVYLLPEEDELEALIEALLTGPSVVKLTPAHLSAMEPLLPPDIPVERLPRALVIGGEALTAEQVRFWRTRYPSVQLFNEYGPTETVVGCCVQRIDDGVRQQGNLPIGRPVDGAQLYVLDERLELSPIGVPGELCVAGYGVSLGYVGRPALTAERFLPNPFADSRTASGTVMYRTGDVALMRKDGVFEYLGRSDDQVQLRGYRIELAEIESALRRHPAVFECAAACMDNLALLQVDAPLRGGGRPQAQCLVAYVEATKEITAGELDAHLRSELPAYMAPQHYEFVDDLPLTPNGKVDRQGLPAIVRKESRPKYAAPRNENERRLQAVWQEVLGEQSIGVEDNFFDRGGDSIGGMQIIAGARRAGLKLTPQQLFEHQTIATQAAVAAAVAPVVSASSRASGEVPLGPIQQAFLRQRHVEPHHFNQGVLLRIAPQVELASLRKAIETVVHHHDAFRLRFECGPDSEWRQWYADEIADIVVEDVDLSDAADYGARLDEELCCRQSDFDLSEGPLFRAARIRGPHGDDRLFLLAHHLIVDAVSWRVVLRDLVGCWNAGGLPAAPTNTQSLRRELSRRSIDGWTDLSRTYLYADADEYSRRLVSIDEAIDEAMLLTAFAQTMKQFTGQPR
ncbi:MAG: amino acid adenylation domain-containing protein, partial [Planctomycetota bacterium]